MTEADRILSEYKRRSREISSDVYALTTPAALFMLQQRARRALSTFRRERILPLAGKKVLEVGCGSGGWLPFLEDCGAARENLAGIDLDPSRAAAARRRLSGHPGENGTNPTPGADIRCGDATALPWADASFDLVVQSTVFTSVLDAGVKRALANEMVRVLKPGGAILWYDFCYDNPSNRNVRGIGRKELHALFPSCRIRLRRVTLAPPLARFIVPYSWLAAILLEELYFLNTHYLAVIRTSESGNDLSSNAK